MQGAPTDILNTTDIGLREAFFLEIISILEKVQFKEVNKITSSVTRIQESIPSNLRDRYIRSLIKLIGSGAWHAEPIAKSTLLSLPQEMLKSTFNIYDKEFFLWHSNEEFHKEFLRKYFSHWPKDKAKLFNDYLELSRLELLNKYDMSFKRSNNN